MKIGVLRNLLLISAIASQVLFLKQQIDHISSYHHHHSESSSSTTTTTAGNHHPAFLLSSLKNSWSVDHSDKKSSSSSDDEVSEEQVENLQQNNDEEDEDDEGGEDEDEPMNHLQDHKRSSLLLLDFRTSDLFTEHEKELLGQVKIPHSFAAATNDEYSFGACLLVMDSNHLLTEWIAYHYYALPLRALVIAVDPKSRFVPPTTILHKWRPFIEIIEWGDDDFSVACRNVDAQTMARYMCRQQTFMRKCARQLKEQHHVTYALYQDVDEYLTLEISKFLPEQSEEYQNVLQRMHQPGHLRQFILDVEDNNKTTTDDPTIRKIKQVGQAIFNATCFTYPRVLHISKESPASELQQNIPDSVDYMSLNTVRFQYRSPRIQSNGKGMIHLNRLPRNAFVRYVRFKVHQPFDICNKWNRPEFGKQSLFHANHYVGSIEAATFQDRYDPRNLTERFLSRQNLGRKDYRKEPYFRTWVQAFYNWQNNTAVADYLLKDSGLSVYNNTKEAVYLE